MLMTNRYTLNPASTPNNQVLKLQRQRYDFKGHNDPVPFSHVDRVLLSQCPILANKDVQCFLRHPYSTAPVGLEICVRFWWVTKTRVQPEHLVERQGPLMAGRRRPQGVERVTKIRGEVGHLVERQGPSMADWCRPKGPEPESWAKQPNPRNFISRSPMEMREISPRPLHVWCSPAQVPQACGRGGRSATGCLRLHLA
jgi:hypothetical protein